MKHARLTYISVEDYLHFEQAGRVRHDYVCGQIFALAGNGDAHNQVAGNVYARLREHLRDTLTEGDPIELRSVGLKLSMAQVYEDVVQR